LPREVLDRFGKNVSIGSRVRVVAIPPDALHDRDADEQVRICSMLGEVFEVEEIDVLGNACGQKWWHVSPTRSFTHGLTLAPAEFELV